MYIISSGNADAVTVPHYTVFSLNVKFISAALHSTHRLQELYNNAHRLITVNENGTTDVGLAMTTRRKLPRQMQQETDPAL